MTNSSQLKIDLIDILKGMVIVGLFIVGIYEVSVWTTYNNQLISSISNQSYFTQLDDYTQQQIFDVKGSAQTLISLYSALCLFAIALAFSLYDSLILKTELQELKGCILNAISQTTQSDELRDSNISRQNRDYSQQSSEDIIIFEHLFDRHKNLLSYVDAVDMKFAQIIALNGVILSFIIFAAGNAKSFNIFIIGIAIIIISMITGAIGYYTRNFYPGASVKFFEDYDTFPNGLGMIKLKQQLLLDIQRNEKKLERKANIFNIMLPLVIIGLIVILVGYYA